MVRLIFTMIFIHIIVLCIGQQTTAENKILFNASFDKDSVFMGDTLKITISYKNNSEDTLKLYSEGRVAMYHYHPTMFINYESIERAFYILCEYSNRNSIIWLKPGEEFQYTFDIKAKKEFFYEGENTVKVYYRNIWDEPAEYKKRKKQKIAKQDTTIVLYSPPIKITVNKKYNMTCIQCDSLYNRICSDNPAIWGHPEHLAQFPEREEELMTFLCEHIQYPIECKEKAIQGYVVIKFIIDESGKIVCPYILKSPHPLVDEEALRVINLKPDWKPASNNGIPCKTCSSLPILFKL